MTQKLPRNDEFLKSVIPSMDSVLAQAIKWINVNMEPDDIWNAGYLTEFVRAEQESPDSLFGEAAINSHVRQHRSPEDVFSYSELAAWAETHGYIQKSP